MPNSPLVALALELQADCAAEYEEYIYSYEESAEEACRGKLMNARGIEKGIRTVELLSGVGHPAIRKAYGSEELLEYVAEYPLMSLKDYEEEFARTVRGELGWL